MASYDTQPSAQRISEPIYDHAKPRDCPHPHGHSTSDAYFRCQRACVKRRVKQMREDQAAEEQEWIDGTHPAFHGYKLTEK